MGIVDRSNVNPTEPYFSVVFGGTRSRHFSHLPNYNPEFYNLDQGVQDHAHPKILFPRLKLAASSLKVHSTFKVSTCMNLKFENHMLGRAILSR